MKKSIILILVMFAFGNIYGAHKIVSGVVVLNNEFALGNILVTAKKSKASVTTNNQGEYSIACEDKDVLIFTANSFTKVKKSVKGKVKLDVSMKLKFDTKNVDKVAELGYIRPQDLSAVKKSIEDSSEDFSMYSDIYDVIKSKFPYVSVNGTNILIRGRTTLLGNNFAVNVVNGSVVADFNHIQPFDVKSIKVLAGSDAAKYGSKGAAGVIEVITK